MTKQGFEGTVGLNMRVYLPQNLYPKWKTKFISVFLKKEFGWLIHFRIIEKEEEGAVGVGFKDKCICPII